MDWRFSLGSENVAASRSIGINLTVSVSIDL